MNVIELYRKASISETALIISNLIPLMGVFFFGWDIFTILILYWSESAIIGFFNVLKMVLAKGTAFNIKNQMAPLVNAGQKAFMIPFFMIHYGMFMIVHLVFIWTLFGQTQEMSALGRLISLMTAVLWGFASLFISHAVSFYTNFIKNNEYQTATVHVLMMKPYGRIIIMHITILGGAFILNFFGWPGWVLALMVLLKSGVDLAAHRWEHALRQSNRVV